jgi:hypothetical protein
LGPTCCTPTEEDFVRVSAAVAAGEVQGHVQVAYEVDEELQRLVRRRFGPLHEDIGNIPDCAEDVPALLALPAARTGEGTCLRRVVAHRADVVQRCRPTHLVAQLIRPGRHRRKMALRLGRVGGSVVEDGAHAREYTRVEMNLRYCSGYFVACRNVGMLLCAVVGERRTCGTPGDNVRRKPSKDTYGE